MSIPNNSETVIHGSTSIRIDGIVHVDTIHESSTEFFDITHGITLWSHGSLGLTIARDNVYYGKPLQLVHVFCQPKEPVFGDGSPEKQHGRFWLDTTTDTPVLKTYRRNSWIKARVSPGTIVYDRVGDRLLIFLNSGWQTFSTTPL